MQEVVLTIRWREAYAAGEPPWSVAIRGTESCLLVGLVFPCANGLRTQEGVGAKGVGSCVGAAWRAEERGWPHFEGGTQYLW